MRLFTHRSTESTRPDYRFRPVVEALDAREIPAVLSPACGLSAGLSVCAAVNIDVGGCAPIDLNLNVSATVNVCASTGTGRLPAGTGCGALNEPICIVGQVAQEVQGIGCIVGGVVDSLAAPCLC